MLNEISHFLTRTLIPILGILALTGCQVTRWTQVQIASDPAPAVVTIVETGNTVAMAPGLYEIPAKFMCFEPKRLVWTFSFRRLDRLDDQVRVELSDWYNTREDAKHQKNPPRIYGLLKPIPSLAPMSAERNSSMGVAP